MEKQELINNLSFEKLLLMSKIAYKGRLYNNQCFIISIHNEWDNDILKYPIRINAFIIVICSKGKIDFSCDLKHYTISSNTAFIYRPGMIIQVNTLLPSKLTVLICTSEFITQLNIKIRNIATNFLQLKDVNSVSLTHEECEHLQCIFSMAYSEIKENNSNPYYHEMLNSIITSGIYRLLYIMGQNITLTNKVEEISPKREEQYFRQFMHLLSLHYRSERSVKFYATQIHLNPKYLSHLIKTASGKSPVEWIDSYVILEAKNLIKYSDMNIQEIAYALNFPNQSFFGKYFKKHTGISPKRYRLQQ